MNKKIYLYNDKKIYNLRYRASLIHQLDAAGYQVLSRGIFDSPASFLKLAISFWSKGVVVTSNLKTNLVFMMLPWVSGVVIVNGMGRWRDNAVFRLCFCCLVACNAKKSFAIQNYADYRYLRRFAPCARYYWVPGSGGKLREVGTSDSAVVVTRAEKIESIRESLAALRGDFCGEVNVVGCSRNVLGDGYRFRGYLPQDEIFKHGRKFFQPDGYGEGFPHSLADAICSNMEIYIAKASYVQYGLNLLGARYSDGPLSRLIVTPEIVSRVAEDSVNRTYIDIIKKHS